MQINKTGQSLDSFAVLTVGANTNFVVGEKVTGGTTGATAKVSGKIGSTKLLIKGVKTGATAVFTGTETITGNKSSASSAMSAFAWGQELTRHAVADGAQEQKVREVATVTDQGVVALDARGLPQVKTAIRLHASKVQTVAGDASTVPSFSVKRIVKAGTYSIAKAAVLRLVLTASEAVTVTGTPQVALTLFGNSAVAMSYVASKSTPTELVFEYTLQTGDAQGQIVSIGNTWTNNGGSIKDKKADGTDSAALSPSTWTVPSVTGIIVGA